MITLGTPNTLVHILGDGNCFFRSISYYLFGNENQHGLVRQLITSYMLTIPNEFESIVMPRCQNILPRQKISARKTKPVETIQGYINQSHMCHNGIWATECEILSAAALLNTNIYIYSFYGNTWKWLRYSPKDIIQNAIPSEQAIYIQHTNQNHFDCVIGVNKDTIETQCNTPPHKTNKINPKFPTMIQKEFDRQQLTKKTQLGKKAANKIENEQKNQNNKQTNKSNNKRKRVQQPNKNQSKQPKTKETTHATNKISNDKNMDSSQLSECIENFLKETNSGPVYVCTCCQQTFFKKSVSEFNMPENVDDSTFDLINECATAFKSFQNKEWICISCKTSIQTHKKIPPMSIANRMGFPYKVPQLYLHHTEERLIALRNPFMQIRQLPRGGQKSIHGNVVNIPCDIRPVANTLPRNLKDSDTISVKYKRKLSYEHAVTHENIRPTKVLEAIHYLLETSELYKDAGVQINTNWESEINNDKDKETRAYLGKSEKKHKHNNTNQNKSNNSYANSNEENESTSTTTSSNEFLGFDETFQPLFSNEYSNKSSKTTNKMKNKKSTKPTLNRQKHISDSESESISSDSSNSSFDFYERNESTSTSSSNEFLGFDQTLKPLFSNKYSKKSSKTTNKNNKKKSRKPTSKKHKNISDSESESTSSDSSNTSSDNDGFNEDTNTPKIVGNKDTCLMQEIVNANSIYSYAPSEGQQPLSMFKDINAEYLAFPTIFCGRTRPHNSERTIPVYYSQIVKWELRSHDRRVAMSIPNIFFKLKKKQIKEVIDKPNIALRRVTSKNNNITAGDILNSSVVDDMIALDTGYRIFKDMRNTPPYFEKRKKDIFAMIRQLNLPTFFISLSSAETHWLDLLRTLGKLVDQKDYTQKELEEMDWKTKTRLIQSDPVTCTRHFDNRVKQFIKTVLKSGHNPIGVFRDFFYRVEFQQRGSPHIHMLVWNDNAPLFDTNAENFDDIHEYIDKYISCSQDIDPQLSNLIKIQTHSHSKTCRKKGKPICRFGYPIPPMKSTTILSPIPKEDLKQQDKDNYFRIQTKLDEMKNGEDLTHEQFLETLEMNEEDYILAIRCSLKQDKVFLKRKPSEIRINPYMKNLIGAWQANHDIQYVIDAYACAMYIISYINKSQRGMSAILDKANKEAKRGDMDLKQKIRHIGNQFLNNVEVSAQEAIYLLLELSLTESTRSVIFINTSPPEQRAVFIKDKEELQKLSKNSTDIMKSNDVKRYTIRPKQLEHLCLAEFISKWKIIFTDRNEEIDIETYSEIEEYESSSKRNLTSIEKGPMTFKERGTAAVIRFVNFNKDTDTENYYREQIMLYLPYRNENTDILSTYSTYKDHYISQQNTIQENASKYTHAGLMADIEQAQEKLQKDLNEEHYDDMFPNVQSKEKEDEDEGSTLAEGFIFFQPDKNNPTQNTGDIGLDLGLTTASVSTEISQKIISDKDYFNQIRLLNKSQREFYTHIIQSLENDQDTILHLFLSGGAGVGKSVLITAIYQTLLRKLCSKAGEDPNCLKILLLAPTGKAAFNIGGQTLHSVFKLPTHNMSQFKHLDASTLNTQQVRYKDVQFIIIDEISMVGARMFSYINTRLQHYKHNDKLFGGVSIILVGDLYQLKPIKDTWIFNTVGPSKYLQTNLFMDNFLIHELTQIMRQKDDLEFAELLNKIRTYENKQNINLDMIKNRITTIENCPPSAVRLYTTNRFVKAYNEKQFQKISPINRTEIKALDSISAELPENVKKRILRTVKNEEEYPQTETYGLATILKVGVGLKYDITINIDTEDGLTNGASCILEYIDKREQNLTNNMPSILWIQLPEQKMGKNMRKTYKHLYNENIKNTWTPIMVVSRNFFYKTSSKTIAINRVQFPLTLSSAKTIHKSQGSTLDEVVVDMSGTVQRHCHYVAFSRVTKITGLYITKLSPEKITVDPQVKEIYEELRQYNPLKLCYTPTYHIKKTNPNKLVISFLNARSLNLHFEDMKVDQNFTSTDIMFFAETRFKTTDTNQKFHLDNYTIYRNDQTINSSQRPSHGMLCYINNNIIINQQKKFSSSDIEWIFIEISYKNKIIQIVSLYKAPSTNQTTLIKTLKHIKTFIDNQNTIIILGDFNIDIYQKNKTLTNIVNKIFNTTQTIKDFTTTYQTTIDLIFTNDKDNTSGTIYLPWTDHRLIWINI